jgi:hypothetical protein
MAKGRWAEAPDTSSIDEKSSVPGLYASFWYGFVGSAGHA